MRFFSNSQINRLYLHSGLQSMAQNCGGVFVYAYLLKAGLGLAAVMVIAGGMVLARIALRLAVLPVAEHIGLRNAIMLGSLVEACGYLTLPHVKGADAWLLAYLALAAFGTTFYWTCYHALVARLGDAEHRGSQVSLREAVFAITAIVGPLFGGLALTLAGPAAAFGTACACAALGVVPLLGVSPSHIEPEAQLAKGTLAFASALAFFDGLVAMAINHGWRLVLFQTVGSKFDSLGGAMAMAGLFGAAVGLSGGRLGDLGHHRRSVQLSVLAMAFVIALEVVGHDVLWLALIATMAAAVATPLYMSSIMAPFYNQGQVSGCALRFNVAGENAFDFGFGMAFMLAALLVTAGANVGLPLAIGLLGCAGVYAMLRGRDKDGFPIEATAR